MKYRTEEIFSKKLWEGFVKMHKPKSFLQSWNWGETNKLTGHKIIRLGFYNGKKLVGVCLVIKESARRGPYLVVPGGPIMHEDSSGLLKFVIKSLRELGTKEKVWFIRIRPEIEDSKESWNKFRRLGFVPAQMHLHAENTWVLDINKEEESLLAEMRKTTRYLIRKSMKSNLCLEVSKDLKISDALYKLQEITAERHNFVGFSKRLFSAQMETFGKDDQANFFSCFLGKKRLACAIIIFYADAAYYHHSGSVNGFSNIPFSYFLQ